MEPCKKSQQQNRSMEIERRTTMEEYKLVFKWGVSRGRNTYGYTICSLWVDDKKVAMCNGGGYDMKGTCLGDWVATKFKKELLTLTIPYKHRNGEKIQG